MVIGTNGTGKTTKASRIIDGRRGCVFSSNWQFSIDSKKQKLYGPGPDVDENETLLVSQFRKSANCVFVIDDLRQWIAGGARMKSALIWLFAERRKRNIDLILVCHSFSQVPGEILDYEPKFLLFKTTRKPNTAFLASSENPDYFLNAAKDVNAKAKSNRFYCKLLSDF